MPLTKEQYFALFPLNRPKTPIQANEVLAEGGSLPLAALSTQLPVSGEALRRSEFNLANQESIVHRARKHLINAESDLHLAQQQLNEMATHYQAAKYKVQQLQQVAESSLQKYQGINWWRIWNTSDIVAGKIYKYAKISELDVKQALGEKLSEVNDILGDPHKTLNQTLASLAIEIKTSTAQVAKAQATVAACSQEAASRFWWGKSNECLKAEKVFQQKTAELKKWQDLSHDINALLEKDQAFKQIEQAIQEKNKIAEHMINYETAVKDLTENYQQKAIVLHQAENKLHAAQVELEMLKKSAEDANGLAPETFPSETAGSHPAQETHIPELTTVDGHSLPPLSLHETEILYSIY